MVGALFLLLLLGGQDAANAALSVAAPQASDPAVTDSRAGVIQAPDWAAKPDANMVGQVVPDFAKRIEVSGKVKLRCQVRLSGAVEACEVLVEAPADLGYGAAAIRLSQAFQMKPGTVDGLPVDRATVQIPLEFNLPHALYPPGKINYRELVNCVRWHSARLAFLPDDAMSTVGRRRAEALVREVGLKDGRRAESVEADINEARGGGQRGRAGLARSRVDSSVCRNAG